MVCIFHFRLRPITASDRLQQNPATQSAGRSGYRGWMDGLEGWIVFTLFVNATKNPKMTAMCQVRHIYLISTTWGSEAPGCIATLITSKYMLNKLLANSDYIVVVKGMS